MTARISASDITDRLIKPVVTADSSYFTRADDSLDELALEMGVNPESSAPVISPPNYKIKEYLKAMVGLLVCQDNMGVNPRRLVEQGVQEDPYGTKLDFYQKQVSMTQASLTYEVLTGTADDPEDYAYGSIQLFNGG